MGSSITQLWDDSPIAIDAKRNNLVQMAQHDKAKNILFVADDVLPPPNVIKQLLMRRQQGYRVVTGIYWTKDCPTMPYIWKGFLEGPYLDWHVGDFFRVDWAGCDCLMVDMAVFDELEWPWFFLDYKFGEGQVLPPGIGTTEDLWFFTQIKKKGIEAWADTSIQCTHIDRESGRPFFLPADWPQARPGSEIPRKTDRLVADIGCGLRSYPHHLEADVVRIDINPAVKPDILADVRSIPEPAEKYDGVFAAHILEHIKADQAIGAVREWTRILKAGGILEIRVPNITAALEALAKNQATPLHHQIVWGTQINERETHYNGFTPYILESLIRAAGNLEITETVLNNDPIPGWEIRTKATKIKPNSSPEIGSAWEKEVRERGLKATTPGPYPD